MSIIILAGEGKLGNEPMDPFVLSSINMELDGSDKKLKILNFTLASLGNRPSLRRLNIHRETSEISLNDTIYFPFLEITGFFTIDDPLSDPNLTKFLTIIARRFEFLFY